MAGDNMWLNKVSRRSLLAAGAAGLATYAAPALGSTEEARGASFSLRNARLVDGDGLASVGGISVEGGKIVAVGAGVTTGNDVGGATLHPGFFDAGSGIGLHEIDLEVGTHDDAESSDGIVPHARVIDGYNPLSALIPVARRYGVVGGLVLPAGGLVGGQAAFMRFGGDTVAAATLAPLAGIVFNMGHAGTGALPNQPKSRMGVAMKIRDLLDLNEPPKAPEAGKKLKKGEKPPEDKPTRAQKAVRALRTRDARAIFAADRADDILTALDIIREYKLDALLLGCAEGHLVASAIAGAGLPVLLGPITVQPDSFEHLHAVYENAAILHLAGVAFAIRQGGPHMLRDITTEACVAVANGLPESAARAAVFGNAPGFWNLKIGMLRVGYEATFVQCDGDPLQPRTRTTAVWMQGQEMPLTSHQTELYERFKVLK